MSRRRSSIASTSLPIAWIAPPSSGRCTPLPWRHSNGKRGSGAWFSARSPDGVLYRSVEVLQLFVGVLKRLRRIVDAHGRKFRSEGFTTLFGMLAKELDDEYLSIVEDHLRRLDFRDGVLLSAELDEGNKGTRYVLHTRIRNRVGWSHSQSWMSEYLFRDRSGYVYRDRRSR